MPDVTMMSPRLNGLRPTSSGRTSIVPSPRPCAITGMPSRSSRAGTMLARSDTSSTRDASVAGVDDPADEAVGRAHRHPDATPSPAPTDRIANRRGLLNEEPTIRPTAIALRLALAKLQRGLELPVLLDDRLGLDHPLEHRVRSRLSLPFWWAASQ